MMFGLENLFIFGNVPLFDTYQVCLAKFDETCLQKSMPISGKLTITNYLKQNDLVIKPM